MNLTTLELRDAAHALNIRNRVEPVDPEWRFGEQTALCPRCHQSILTIADGNICRQCVLEERLK